MIRYRKNPVKKSVTVTVDGIQYPASYIGKGSFSKVYRVGDRVVYYTRGDCTKEVLSMFVYDRVTHLPEIVRHDDVLGRIDRWHVFSAPYYRDVKRTDTSAWKMMNNVVDLYYREASLMQVRSGRLYTYHLPFIVDRMEEHGILPRSIINAMRILEEIAGNCGGIVRFDFHKKNFGVNEYGTLIFRDPMYVIER